MGLVVIIANIMIVYVGVTLSNIYIFPARGWQVGDTIKNTIIESPKSSGVGGG